MTCYGSVTAVHFDDGKTYRVLQPWERGDDA